MIDVIMILRINVTDVGLVKGLSETTNEKGGKSIATLQQSVLDVSDYSSLHWYNFNFAPIRLKIHS
jgi:hypothetical protein